MNKNSNYSFAVSVSKQPYKNKKETAAAITGGDEGRQMRLNLGLNEKISFKTVSITPSELLQNVLTGYTFCGVFSGFPTNAPNKTYVKKDGYFTLTAKSGDFFIGSYCIGVDIDDTLYTSAKQFVSKLQMQPTFWYTSFSNLQTDNSTGEFKGARFRLIYVFDQEIRNKYFFRYCSYKVHQMIEQSTDETIHDKCGLKCTQYFNGTYIFDKKLSIDYDCSNIVYSYSDFSISEEEFITFLDDNCKLESPDRNQIEEMQNLKCSLLSKNIINKRKRREIVILSDSDKTERSTNETDSFNCQLIRDAKSLEWSVFYNRYKHFYEYVFRVEREDWSTIKDSAGNAISFQYCDEDFLELKWIPKRLKDGQHRKRTLFHRGWQRRIIKPSITPDELLYNLLVDRERFIDNTDGEISVYRVQEIVRACFEFDIESYKTQYENIYQDTINNCSKKQVIIHRTSKSRIKANSLLKELRWMYLDEAYNKSLSVAENLQILNDSDFLISRSTLYNYCLNRGIITKKKAEDKYNRFISLHQDYLSCRDEQRYLEENGLKLSLGSLQLYRKRYEQDNAA